MPQSLTKGKQRTGKRETPLEVAESSIAQGLVYTVGLLLAFKLVNSV